MVGGRIQINSSALRFTMEDLYKTADIGSLADNASAPYKSSSAEKGTLNRVSYAVIASIILYAGCRAPHPTTYEVPPPTTTVTESKNPRVHRRQVIPPSDPNSLDSIGMRLEIALKYSDPNDIKKALKGLKKSK
jgi:hypothetical protein